MILENKFVIFKPGAFEKLNAAAASGQKFLCVIKYGSEQSRKSEKQAKEHIFFFYPLSYQFPLIALWYSNVHKLFSLVAKGAFKR